MLPKDNVVPGHRVFGLRVSDLTLPDAGILAGDFIILDADIPPKNGDIVIMSTPDGLAMTYYQERGDHLELRPEKEGFKKTYHLKESKMIGRLVYHIKKY
jgi:SOS-response transcriptional repressor LexA